MARPLWLVRPRADGGSDYVSFQPAASRTPGHGGSPMTDQAATGLDQVEMREGSHLPPQMPLLKRRQWLPSDEAELQSRRLQQGGYRHSEPLF
ncbi:hypothetical protein [Vulcanococcus limneticus]|uniref:hypothetical protein n=1 Tax=Vulcanococcus limneticus TaxID=2170428 RepID=UPI00398BDEA6